MIGYRKKLELAQLRLKALGRVITHERKDPVSKPNHNYLASKLGGKNGRKASGL